jgi:hypothetical protein
MSDAATQPGLAPRTVVTADLNVFLLLLELFGGERN